MCITVVVSLSSPLPKLTESNLYVLALPKQMASGYDYLQAMKCMTHTTLVLFSTTLLGQCTAKVRTYGSASQTLVGTFESVTTGHGSRHGKIQLH